MGFLTKLKAVSSRNSDPSISSTKVSAVSDAKTRYNYAKRSRFRHACAARDFYINQESPHKVWKPNEQISGEAVLVLKDDLENVAVRLSLIGEVRIRGSGSKTHCDQLFEKTTLVYGDQEEVAPESRSIVNGLTKGEHRFPFRLKVPSKNIFTSIKFERGSISYCIRCTLEPLRCSDPERVLAACEKNISVMVPLDVSDMPKPNTKSVVLQSPSAVKQIKLANGEQDASSSFTRRTGGSKNSGSTVNTSGSLKTVTINVDLPSSGYVIGEVIPVKLNLCHYREYSHSTGLIATLVRICRVGGASKENPMETYRKDICQTVSPIYVNPDTFECSVTVYLKIPLDAFPTLRLPDRKFSFQYYVEVLVNLSRKNIAFTESNRVVDTTTNSHVSASPGKTIEETFTLLQRKIRSGSETEPFKNNDRESMIFFKDLINVDKLKRLRNVTGMSIEVIVGTNRSEIPQNSSLDEVEENPETTNSGLQSIDYTNTAVNNYTVAGHSPLGDCKDVLNFDGGSVLPLPLYTPNSHYNAADDKDELELQRLQELESEPPMAT
ncbi:Rim8p [Lachancea thermotolerans]